jgi:hypothetical protein
MRAFINKHLICEFLEDSYFQDNSHYFNVSNLHLNSVIKFYSMYKTVVNLLYGSLVFIIFETDLTRFMTCSI